MALKTLVKVSGINNLSDARYCAGMNVEFLGFSPQIHTMNYTELSKYKEITSWLSGTKYVGELTKLPLAKNLEDYDFDVLQIQDETLISEAKKFGKPLFLVFEVKQVTDFDNFIEIARKYRTEIDYFLLKSTQVSCTKVIPDLKNICAEFPIILNFADITPENVDIVLAQIQPDGIGLHGGHEISPGLKDFDGLADMLEALEKDA